MHFYIARAEGKGNIKPQPSDDRGQGSYIHRNTLAQHGSYYDTCPAVNTSAVRLESGGSFDRRPIAMLPSHDCFCCLPAPGVAIRTGCSVAAQPRWLSRRDRLC